MPLANRVRSGRKQPQRDRNGLPVQPPTSIVRRGSPPWLKLQGRERHRLPRSGPQIPSADLRRPDRPGGDGAHPDQRLRLGPHRSGLHADRRARRRQDHHRPPHRPGAQLSRPAERRDAGLRPPLRGDPRIPPHGRDRDGRRLQHRRRQHARDHRQRALCAGPGALQGLHHRRSPHAVEERLQRAAEDAGRAAAACEVHLRHHRDQQGSGHYPVALPALRPEAARRGPAGNALRGNIAREGRRSRPSPMRWR